MSTKITYLIKHKDLDLYIINRPTDTRPEIKYCDSFYEAREFDGTDNSKIDMTQHVAIKKTVTENVDYEEVNIDD
ncbi:DUF2483 family protein [Staphylococcus massiliensis]|uniref:Uncharacterized protein n=1 Tax=Staphylococcus massiliensis S46 TaxID=1229783 RepID=K9AWA0_9STAP|nr:DUF2483 family protein [Staphylococcus massiliensis]EKU50346.1 hypothetical protein C273_01850 [Staphylococcus massiliensis S46]